MGSKYKGTDQHAPRAGLNRLRRANQKDAGRSSGWERLSDDDASMERAAPVGKTSHFAVSVLARFNRLAGGDAPEGPEGTISGFQGNLVVVRGPDGAETPCSLRRNLLKRIGGVRNPLAVGDRIHWLPDQAVITAVQPRRSVLARADSHNKALVHVLAANLDLVLVVAALTRPTFKPGFIDRALVLAAANGLDAAVVLTKSDLVDPAPALDTYAALGIPAFAVRHDRDDHHRDLRTLLAGRTVVVAGQSGVGKSTLLNALFGLTLRTGEVDEDGLGRHTTTSAKSIPVGDGTVLVDTPGVRECAVTGMTGLDVCLLMPDLARFHPQCRFADCTHDHEPDCAVQAAVERGEIAVSRYLSYRAMVGEDLAQD
jgi:ribosome biogenesis GTPase